MPGEVRDKPPLMAKHSETARKKLVTSGGWLYDLISTISSITGVWDVTLLSLGFLFSWIFIRTSDRILALIMARVFDTTIPLQHQLSENKSVTSRHKEHLASYWTAWYVATAIEVACYFLLHPDMFTLVTCFKTTLMLIYWLGRNSDRTFWTSGGIKWSDPSSTTTSSHSHTETTTSTQPPTPMTSSEESKYSNMLKKYSSDARKELVHRLNKFEPQHRKGFARMWEKKTGQDFKDGQKEMEKKRKERRERNQGS